MTLNSPNNMKHRNCAKEKVTRNTICCVTTSHIKVLLKCRLSSSQFSSAHHMYRITLKGCQRRRYIFYSILFRKLFVLCQCKHVSLGFPIAIPLRAQFLGVYRARNCAQVKSTCVGNPCFVLFTIVRLNLRSFKPSLKFHLLWVTPQIVPILNLNAFTVFNIINVCIKIDVL